MTRAATLAVLCVVALTGCRTSAERARARVQRSASGIENLARPVTTDQVKAVARAFMRAYLRAEVHRAQPRDTIVLRRTSTLGVARDATLLPRPTNRGFPLAGVLARLRLLPVRAPERWVVAADVERDAALERWELHLAGSARGPIVTSFQSTAS